MIVSHKYRFIYLRTEKTGSTSLENLLREVMSPDEDPHAIYSTPLSRSLPVPTGWLRKTWPQHFGLHYHSPASDVRKALGAEVFDSYFKFAVERNPWERQLSLYYHRQGRKEGTDLNRFNADMQSALFTTLHHVKLRNWQVYSIDNQVVADKVIRFETLQDDVTQVFQQIGLPHDGQLPRRNVSSGGTRAHYSTYYTDQTRDLIGQWYANEIAHFGFQFDDQRSNSNDKEKQA